MISSQEWAVFVSACEIWLKNIYMNFKSARLERCWAYFSCGFTNKTINASWKILGLTASHRKEIIHFSEKERMKYRKGEKRQALHAPFAPYASISSPPAPFSQTWFFHSCVYLPLRVFQPCRCSVKWGSKPLHRCLLTSHDYMTASQSCFAV